MMPLEMLVLRVGHWFYLNIKQLYTYTKDRTSRPNDKLVISLDSSRLTAMGAGPSRIGEGVYKLLTAKGSDHALVD